MRQTLNVMAPISEPVGRAGRLEFVARGVVSGWVSGSEALCRDWAPMVRVNGQDVGRARWIEPVAPHAEGVCKIWYAYTLSPACLQGPGPHRVEAVWADSGGVLGGSPQQVGPDGVTGWFGGVRQFHLVGWAVPQTATAAMPELTLFDGDDPVMPIHPEIERPDLVSMGVEGGRVGIRVPLPERFMDGQPHVLGLRWAQGARLLRGSPVTFQATPEDRKAWHAPRAVADAQRLSRDLQFDAAAQRLMATQEAHGLDARGQVALADALLQCGRADEARAWVEARVSGSSVEWPWAELKLRWIETFGQTWPTWFEQASRLAPRLTGGARLNLLVERIRALINAGQFRRAERGLGFYTRGLLAGAWLMTDAERTHRLLRSVAYWQALGEWDRSQALLDQIRQRPLSDAHQEALISRSLVQERYTQRRDAHVVAWIHQSPAFPPRAGWVVLPPAGSTASAQAPKLRVVVLLHLFYPELWDEFEPLFQSLRGTQVHLRVTVGDRGVPDALAQTLHALDPDMVIQPVVNKGFDIGAHWQSLDAVDLTQFDVVVLLQSKRSTHLRSGAAWRANLCDALMGSQAVWQANLAAFAQDPQLGMVGSLFHRGYRDSWQYRAMGEVLTTLGVPTSFEAIHPIYEYVEGTMFMMRAHLLAEMHQRTRHRLDFPSYEELSIGHRLDRSLSHAMERAFGIYTRWRGYHIGWRGTETAST